MTMVASRGTARGSLPSSQLGSPHATCPLSPGQWSEVVLRGWSGPGQARVGRSSGIPLILNLGCWWESTVWMVAGAILKGPVTPGSYPQRSQYRGSGWGLGIRSFRRCPGDSDVQPRWRAKQTVNPSASFYKYRLGRNQK